MMWTINRRKASQPLKGNQTREGRRKEKVEIAKMLKPMRERWK